MMVRALACLVVFAVALAVYDETLLPGLDLGDTASFQAAVGSSQVMPRQGYPLYFAGGNLFLRLHGGEPARTLNLFSAVTGAAAAAILTGVAAELAGATLAGLFGGLLFAFSYTFWSQSIIAEVYALHLLLTGLSLAALLWWSKNPSLGRLAVFFAVYALAFGNHLSTVLLAPAAVAFLLLSAPEGPVSVARPRVIATAAAIALLGALQYSWNLWSLWNAPEPPDSWMEAVRSFWFDVTKADWLQSMAFAVPGTMMRARGRMYWFDLQQQFGLFGVVVASIGALVLFRSPRRAALVLFFYLASVFFAFSYNVGDIHVFFLPSHYAMALLAAIGAAGVADVASRFIGPHRKVMTTVIGALLLAYPVYRAADAYPALDRSRDRRPTELLDRLTAGLDRSTTIFAADYNWQIMNGLDYYTKYRKPDLPCFSLAHSMLQFPLLVSSNGDIGRDVVLSAGSAHRLVSAYGPLYPFAMDSRVTPDSILDFLRAQVPDTVYIVGFLAPLREFTVDSDSLASVNLVLSAHVNLREFPYNVIAGRIGHPPDLIRSSRTPFRVQSRIDGLAIDVRMESWLATDTIRRAGFGHVIVNGRHALTLERGVSGVALDRNGRPTGSVYEGGLYAVGPRYHLLSSTSSASTGPAVVQ